MDFLSPTVRHRQTLQLLIAGLSVHCFSFSPQDIPNKTGDGAPGHCHTAVSRILLQAVSVSSRLYETAASCWPIFTCLPLQTHVDCSSAKSWTTKSTTTSPCRASWVKPGDRLSRVQIGQSSDAFSRYREHGGSIDRKNAARFTPPGLHPGYGWVELFWSSRFIVERAVRPQPYEPFASPIAAINLSQRAKSSAGRVPDKFGEVTVPATVLGVDCEARETPLD
jgi:hypothetical protein